MPRAVFWATCLAFCSACNACPFGFGSRSASNDLLESTSSSDTRNFGDTPEEKDFLALTAADKLDFLWAKVLANSSYGPWPAGQVFDKLMNESMEPTVNWRGDEMPTNRTKNLHNSGLVAKGRFVWTNKDTVYTGLLRPGQCEHMLMRFAIVWKPCDQSDTLPNEVCSPCSCGSNCGEPIEACVQHLTECPGNPRCDSVKNNFNKMFAFKVLRSGVASGNFFAGENLVGDGSWNPLSANLSTKFPHGGFQGPVTSHFHSVSNWGFALGLSDMAMWDQHGNKADDPTFPWQLIFYPDPAVAHKFPDAYTGDPYAFKGQLGGLLSGTVLYQVYAKDGPTTPQVHVGHIELSGEFKQTLFGDTDLFFHHTTVEKDMLYGGERVKEWHRECPNETACLLCPFQYECESVAPPAEPPHITLLQLILICAFVLLCIVAITVSVCWRDSEPGDSDPKQWPSLSSDHGHESNDTVCGTEMTSLPNKPQG